MPSLDVSEVFEGDEFLDEFTAIRSTETIGRNGRSTTTDDSYPCLYGIFTDAGGAILEQTSDASTSFEYIEVHTQSRLRNGSAITKSDRVVWHGVTYVVKEADNYSHYGAGFMTLRCQLTDLFSVPEDDTAQ